MTDHDLRHRHDPTLPREGGVAPAADHGPVSVHRAGRHEQPVLGVGPLGREEGLEIDPARGRRPHEGNGQAPVEGIRPPDDHAPVVAQIECVRREAILGEVTADRFGESRAGVELPGCRFAIVVDVPAPRILVDAGDREVVPEDDRPVGIDRAGLADRIDETAIPVAAERRLLVDDRLLPAAPDRATPEPGIFQVPADDRRGVRGDLVRAASAHLGRAQEAEARHAGAARPAETGGVATEPAQADHGPVVRDAPSARQIRIARAAAGEAAQPHPLLAAHPDPRDHVAVGVRRAGDEGPAVMGDRHLRRAVVATDDVGRRGRPADQAVVAVSDGHLAVAR